jgi:hypothetical protein
MCIEIMHKKARTPRFAEKKSASFFMNFYRRRDVEKQEAAASGRRRRAGFETTGGLGSVSDSPANVNSSVALTGPSV